MTKMKPLSKTEEAVAKAVGRLRAMDEAGAVTLSTVEAMIIVQLGRANTGFDYDMFEACIKRAKAEYPN